MGCDIHAFVEYADAPSKGAEPYWQNFVADFGSRNYLMFGILAGVRGADERAFPPKGMPSGRLSWQTDDKYWLRVAPPDHPEWANLDGWVSQKIADRWVADGSSKAEGPMPCKRVSHPDWHSHSWLTLDELKRAAARYAEVVTERWPGEAPEAPAEWRAIIAAMTAFEEAGCLTRIVFWFDN